MPKYITRSYAGDNLDDWAIHPLNETPYTPTIQVMSEVSLETDTGLYDSEGRRLYRIEDRVPLGFHKAV